MQLQYSKVQCGKSLDWCNGIGFNFLFSRKQYGYEEEADYRLKNVSGVSG